MLLPGAHTAAVHTVLQAHGSSGKFIHPRHYTAVRRGDISTDPVIVLCAEIQFSPVHISGLHRNFDLLLRKQELRLFIFKFSI